MKAYVHIDIDEATLREQGLDPKAFADLAAPRFAECRVVENGLHAMGLEVTDAETAGYTYNGQPVVTYHVTGRER